MKTHFGFQTVDAKEKAPLVRGVFNRVASRYDMMNDAMSFGLHRSWKNRLVASLRLPPQARLLDLAGGTGDVAFRVRATYQDAEVTLADINLAMLNEGRARAFDRNTFTGIEWVCANAETLPLEGSRFDAATMAFGIRNVTDIPAALKEIHRVLKPGGQFRCLEFSPVEATPLKQVYDAFSFHLIPRMGKLLAGDGAPYQYLVESIRRFPSRERFAEMLREAGFSRIDVLPMAGGVVCQHTGWKL